MSQDKGTGLQEPGLCEGIIRLSDDQMIQDAHVDVLQRLAKRRVMSSSALLGSAMSLG
jgi:hypothetical protein